MIYRTDYHIHSYFSDGRAAPEEYIAQAIEAGLKEIGFSEHLTLFKEQPEWNINPFNISHYLNHIATLKRRTSEIRVKIGLEVDFFNGKEQEIKSFLKDFELDYVIGSVHYLGEKTC